MNAAAMPRPSAIPPAAMTGMLSASTTCGTSGMVVSSPMWPPPSMPSAMTASAPARSMRFASATDATTGMTLMPAFFQLSIYLPGLPAPVVSTSIFSSMASWARSSAFGDSSMMFIPSGLSVIARALRISSRM